MLDQKINEFIIKLHRGAHTIPAKKFKAWAFDCLHQLIEFDSGAWITGTFEYGPQAHGIYLHNQPPEMMENYERVKADDFLARKMMEQPGVTHDASHLVPREQFIQMPVYLEHCKIYGMEHTLSTIQIDPKTKIVTFFSLYRSNPDKPYSEYDRQLKQLLMPHLLEAYASSLFIHLHQPNNGKYTADQCGAICDAKGVLYQSEEDFSQLLCREWSDWLGPMLPNEVVSQLKGEQQFKGKQVSVSIAPLNDVFYVTLRPLNALDNLTQREREVADVLIEGLSYKQAAARLSISPSTITNHVNSIYKKLDVSSCSQLAQIIGNGGFEA